MLGAVSYCIAFAAIGAMFFFAIRSTIRTARNNGAIQRHAAELISARKALTHEEFGAQFFSPEERHIASRLRELLEMILIVDVSRVYPDDKLVEDLGFARVDALGPSFLELDVEDAFGVDISQAWKYEITLRDLVTYISKRRDSNSSAADSGQ